MKNKVVFILGPTAVGKSNYGIRLAKTFDGEIISADSVQVFKGLDIGSAKEKDFCGVTHHGIDILEPNESFSAYQFVEYTKEKIKEISKRGHLPIVVGGTGLYVKSLTLGYNFGGAEKDESLREELEKLDLETLFEMLESLDKEVSEKIDRFNKVRLVRAIEIARSNGTKSGGEVEIEPLIIALNMNREKLYERINRRVDLMMEDGLLEEVKKLKAQGLTANDQSMRAIGYKEVLEFLNDEISYDRMVELIKQHTRNYAKRQLTYLKKVDCTFVDVENSDMSIKQVENLVGEFLKD